MSNDLIVTAASGSGKLPPDLLYAVVPLLVLILALDVYCLIDLARAKSVRHMPKLVWAIVILLVSAPIGALVYLFIGRERGQNSDRGPNRAHTEAAAAMSGAARAGQRLDAGGHAGSGLGAGAGADAGVGQGPGADGRARTGPGLAPDGGTEAGVGTGARAGQAPDGAADRYPGDQALVDRRPIVTTSGLTRDYGGVGLFDVDLAVPRGSIYGLVGPNGAGKTTLLSLLSATRRPDRGTISMHIARNQIAVCPDVPEFDGWLTAAEVTDLARSLVAPRAGEQAVTTALATAGLADSAGRRVGGFSRGMLQRLVLWSASPNCLSSTSRPPRWTRPGAPRCSAWSPRCAATGR
jgi:hypothetical protein